MASRSHEEDANEDGAHDDGAMDVDAVGDGSGVGSSMTEAYRKFTQWVQEHKPELVNLARTDLVELFKKANEMPHSEQTPTERLLDACLFLHLTQCGEMGGRRLSMGDGPKTPLEIVLAVRDKYKIEQPRLAMEDEMPEEEGVKIDWDQLGEDMAKFFNWAPGFKCMKGFAMESAQRTRAARPTGQRRRGPDAAVQAPEQHAARDSSGAGQTTEENVSQLWNILQKEENAEGIPFPELVLDHDSYPQTVLNMFNSMFLVKDLKVQVIVNQDGSSTMKAIKHAVPRGEQRDNEQMIVGMNYKKWEEWCCQYPRDRCRMTGERNVQPEEHEAGEANAQAEEHTMDDDECKDSTEAHRATSPVKREGRRRTAASSSSRRGRRRRS